MDNELFINVRFHHATGTTEMDLWHNELHESIQKDINTFKSCGGGALKRLEP